MGMLFDANARPVYIGAHTSYIMARFDDLYTMASTRSLLSCFYQLLLLVDTVFLNSGPLVAAHRSLKLEAGRISSISWITLLLSGRVDQLMVMKGDGPCLSNTNDS